MRETRLLEHYLNGLQAPEDRLLTEARMLVNPELLEKSRWQQLTYRIIKLYSRKKLREEIKQAENQLFTEPEFARFRQDIQTIFNLQQ